MPLETGFVGTSSESGKSVDVDVYQRGEATIGFVEDKTFGIRYLSSDGDDAEQILVEVIGTLPTVSAAAAKASLSAATNVESVVCALRALAITGPREFEADSFARVGWHLMHDWREVQLAAILATTYFNWPEFIRPLRELSAVVPDTEIAQQASVAAVYIESQFTSTE